jgi:hypothetical protein
MIGTPNIFGRASSRASYSARAPGDADVPGGVLMVHGQNAPNFFGE